MRNMNVIISNSQDALFTDIFMIEINIEFGLANWERILDGFSEEYIDLNGAVFEYSSATIVLISALDKTTITITYTWIVHPISEG